MLQNVLPTPAAAQWQLRFDAALRASQEPRRQNETQQEFAQRQAMALNAVKQLQQQAAMSQPQQQPQMPLQAPKSPQQAPQGMPGGLYSGMSQ